MKLFNWFGSSTAKRIITRSRRAASKRPPRCHPAVEVLEDRTVPSTFSIGDAVAIEGGGAYRFTDNFVAPDGYGLASGRAIQVGPDGNVYVASFDTDSVKV